MAITRVVAIDRSSVYFSFKQVNAELLFRALPGTSLIALGQDENPNIIETDDGFVFCPDEKNPISYLFIKSTYYNEAGRMKQYLLVKVVKGAGAKLSVILQDSEYSPVCIMGNGILTLHISGTFLTTKNVPADDSRLTVTVSDICFYVGGEISKKELLEKGKRAKEIKLTQKASDATAKFRVYEDTAIKITTGLQIRLEEEKKKLSLCRNDIASLISAGNALLTGCTEWNNLCFGRSMPIEMMNAVGEMKAAIKAISDSNKSLNCPD